MDFPSGLKYTKDHEWIESTNKTAKIGVTAFAVEQLGDIVHVELPQVGETFAYRTDVSGVSKKPNGLYQDVQKWRYQFK